LEAGQGVEVLRVGDRTVVGGGDNHERCLESRSDRPVDQFRVLAGGSVLGKLVGAWRPQLEADGRRRQEQHDRADDQRDQHRPLQRRGDDRHQARPLVHGRADPPAVDGRADQEEQGGTDDGGDDDAEDHHHRHRPGQRGEQWARHDEQGDDHRDQQRAAGEHRGAARGAAGTQGGVERLCSGRQLLAEAGDHQQRVIHPQSQAHHRADGQGEGVDVEPAGEEVEDPPRGDHGHRAEGERDRGGDRRSEDEQEDDQQERDRQQLAALAGGDRFVLDRPREAGVAGLRGPDRSMDLLLEGAVDLVDRLVDGGFGVDVEVGQDQRPARARPQLGDLAAVPGGEGGHLRVAAQGADQLGPLAVDRGLRAAQEDREWGGVAEVLAQQLVGARGVGAGDVEGGRVESLLDAGADHREHGKHRHRHRQYGTRVAQRQRWATCRIRSRGIRPAPARPPWHQR
jgi:hypothetical protein